jgi:hypothetical protein
MRKRTLLIWTLFACTAWFEQHAGAKEIVLSPSPAPGGDDRPRIQAALDSLERKSSTAPEGGGVLRLTGGVYTIGNGGQGVQGLHLPSNVHLKLDHDAVLVRRSSSQGIQFATLRNKNHAPAAGEEDANIRVTGGTIKTVDPAMTGKHLGFGKAKGVAIDGVRFMGVSGDWNAVFQDCQDVTVTNVVMNSGDELHEDGLHFTGGSDVVIGNCNIECGDDCLAFVFDPAELRGHTDLADVTISNCVLFSHAANALRINVMQPADGEPPLEVRAGPRIRRISVTNVIAKCGDDETDPAKNKGYGIEIGDYNNQHRISDVDISNFQIDASQGTLQPLTIRGADRVRLARVTILDPKLRSTIDSSREVSLVDCTIAMRPGAAPAQQCLLVGDDASAGAIDSTDIRIRGGRYAGATQHGIQLGANKAVVGFEVSNALITGAVDNGLSIINATDGIVSFNRVMDCKVYGIQEFRPSDRNQFMGNYMDGNAYGLAHVGRATKAVQNVVTRPPRQGEPQPSPAP